MCALDRSASSASAAWQSCWRCSCAAPARADDLDDFNRAVEAAMSHHRVAAGYLRTGNIDLAALELEGLREAWGKVSALPRPAAFRDQQRYTGTMLDIAAGSSASSSCSISGRADVARKSLDTIRKSLSDAAARRTASRCWPTACSMPTPRWTRCSRTTASRDWDERRRAGADVLPRHAAALRRHGAARHPRSCRIPPPDRRRAREPRADSRRRSRRATRDLLHRLLIELRSFDHLLAFRYG